MFTFRKILCGFLELEISGRQVKRFLRLCTSQGIKVWNVKYIDDSTYKCSILWNEIYNTKSALRKTRSKIHIVSRHGFPKWIKFWQKHILLFAFMIIVIILSVNVRRYIWHIDINGNLHLSEQTIIKEIQEQGITIGCRKNNINPDDVEQFLRITFSDICWASVHIEGTCLYIEIEEEQYNSANYEDGKKQIASIYSKYNATISSIIVRAGTACVKKGDSVKKGDMLVSSECPILDDNEQATKYLHVKADADIYGRVVYDYNYKIPISEICNARSKNNYKQYFINICNYNFMTPHLGNRYKKFEKEEKYFQIKLGKNFYLPIYYGIIEYKELKPTRISYSQTKADELLKKNLNNYIAQLEKNGAKIISKNIKSKKTDSHYITYGKIWTSELIGVRK